MILHRVPFGISSFLAVPPDHTCACRCRPAGGLQLHHLLLTLRTLLIRPDPTLNHRGQLFVWPTFRLTSQSFGLAAAEGRAWSDASSLVMYSLSICGCKSADHGLGRVDWEFACRNSYPTGAHPSSSMPCRSSHARSGVSASEGTVQPWFEAAVPNICL